MAENPYLVALALVDIGGRRALPLSGRSQPAGVDEAEDPGEAGRGLALELLLRLWQRSDKGPIQRTAAESSLLLLEMPLAEMSEQLPLLKAKWIAGDDTQTLLDGLRSLAVRGWRITVAKHEPIRFVAWP